MSNRVEDLERQVAELQAAVNGLTEELVEMKERVRQVEDAQQVAVDAEAESAPTTPDPEESPSDASDASAPTDGERRTHSDDHVEVVERTGGPSNAGTSTIDETERANDDSPVAEDGEPEPETTASDAAAAASADGDDADDGESDDNDIIVA